MQQIRANLVIPNYFKLVQIGSNFNKQEFWAKKAYFGWFFPCLIANYFVFLRLNYKPEQHTL